MVRSTDPFWNDVEVMNDGSMICKFCGHLFSQKTSITRIKWHLSGVRVRGVQICENVPQEVQDAARAAIDGPPEKRNKYEAGSGNNEVTNTISAPATEQNNEVIQLDMAQQEAALSPGALACWVDSINDKEIESMLGRSSPEELLHDAVETVPRTEMVQHLQRGSSHERTSINQADEPQGDSSGPTDLLCLGLGRCYDQLCSPPVNNDAMMNEVQNMAKVRTAPVLRVLEQSNAVHDCLAGDAGRIPVGVQGMKQGAGEDRICSHLEAENGMGNTGEEGSIQHVDRSFSPSRRTVDAQEIRGEATQKRDLVNQSASFSMEEEEEDVGDNRGRLVQPGAGTSSSRGLKYNSSETRGDPIPPSSAKLVGRAFEENKNVIWSLLMDDKFSTIAIYGMGGVGKTTMVQHIHNKLLKRRNISHHVYWVTVSRDFSINRLQNLVATCLDLDLSSEDDNLRRAVKLSKELVKKQKWILILDDLWNAFELPVVGIPVNLKGCKLIMTTRSEKVCKRMDSQHKIKLKPLCEREAWKLFMEKLGDDKALSPEVEQIAVDVARECAGLPLGIITVARSLRGVDDLHEWRNTLNKLRESKFKDMEDEVFRLLRFSYDQLDDLTLQHCLLYCALFPEDRIIKRDDLIKYWIDEGIMKGMSSQAAFDEGHTMLNKLENVCLLERLVGGTYVKMHDLIRDMAIQIQQENSQIMVKAGVQLKELPDAEEWTENLVRVSLMGNQIEEIPSSHSPRCPDLSTLFLCDNGGLRFISDSFFLQLHGLKVLNLSLTRIETLPDSISDLVTLTALLLSHCYWLRDVPSLRKLRALKRLDLHKTKLKIMPRGMACLSKLWCLRLGSVGEEEFPSGVIPELSQLIVFVSGPSIKVKGKEIRCLRNLETLECYFEGHSDFVEFLRSRDQTKSLSKYRIAVGLLDEEDCDRLAFRTRKKTIFLSNLSINGDGDFQVMFPNDIQELSISKCNDATTLCDISPVIMYATKLEILHILECSNMESLVLSSWFCSAPLSLPSSNSIFSGLKEFYSCNCKSMKKLLPLVLLPNLKNLERLEVEECEKMEEIIGTTEEEISSSSSSSNPITEFILPKLRVLTLRYLPELKSICGAKVICDSLEYITVDTCEKLKRIPICLPLLENGQPSPPHSLVSIGAYPEEWWETVVEWEHPNAKDVLRPFVHFQPD